MPAPPDADPRPIESPDGDAAEPAARPVEAHDPSAAPDDARPAPAAEAGPRDAGEHGDAAPADLRDTDAETDAPHAEPHDARQIADFPPAEPHDADDGTGIPPAGPLAADDEADPSPAVAHAADDEADSPPAVARDTGAGTDTPPADPHAAAEQPEAAAGDPPAASESAEAPAADPALFAHALRIAEALVFASDRPVSPARLQPALPPGCDARAVLTALAAACAGRPAQLVEVAGGFAFRTAPELAPAITRVVEVPRRLPRAAMETLAIVAYHQPVTRAEVEEIRGASLSQSTLELLLDAALIAPRGRKEVPGRPSLWGTTPRFLEQFGLKALSDLPRREELVNEPTLPLSVPNQESARGPSQEPQQQDVAPPPAAA